MLTVSTTGVCTAIIMTTSSTSSSHQKVSTSNNAQQHGRPTAECELNASGTGSSSAFGRNGQSPSIILLGRVGVEATGLFLC